MSSWGANQLVILARAWQYRYLFHTRPQAALIPDFALAPAWAMEGVGDLLATEAVGVIPLPGGSLGYLLLEVLVGSEGALEVSAAQADGGVWAVGRWRE